MNGGFCKNPKKEILEVGRKPAFRLAEIQKIRYNVCITEGNAEVCGL